MDLSHPFFSNPIERRPGVYAVINKMTGRKYIGQSIDLPNRRLAHFSMLKYKNHSSRKMVEDREKYGLESFIFVVIEYINKTENLYPREQELIRLLDPEYNCTTDSYRKKKAEVSAIEREIREEREEEARRKKHSYNYRRLYT